MASRRALILVALLVLLGASPGFTLARQDASPTASPAASPAASPSAGPAEEPLDLAAMVLEAGDLPEDFELAYEYYYDAELFSVQYTGGAITPEQLEETGLVRFYESQYFSTDGELAIRSYASEYETEEGAADGFALLEDESGFAEQLPPDATVEDEPGPEVGEEPKETTVTLGTGFRDGYDLTFRVGRVLVGTAFETFGTTQPDREVAEELATTLFDRVETVLAGEAPGGVDLALPAALLPLADAGVTTQAGYLRAEEVLDEAGPDGAGYLQTVGIGFPSDPQTPVVSISAGVLTPDVDDPAAVLEQVADSTVFSILPRPEDSPRQPLAAVEVAGAEAAVAARAALLPGSFVDSARVTFVVGDQIGVVEVAGAGTAAEAEVTALDLAARQAGCLSAGGACTDAPAGDELQAATLRFFTGEGAAAEEPAAPAADSEIDRQAVFDEVWNTVKQYYVYRTGAENAFYVGQEGVDWALLRSTYEPRALAAASDEEFYTIVGEMVAQLDDDHSRYLTPEQAREDDAYFAGQGAYTGIGVEVIRFSDPARTGTVVYVFPGSPAEEAGIQVRDRIVAVEGEPYDPAAFSELVTELAPAGQPPDDAGSPVASPAAGEPAPSVALTIASPGEAPRDLTVEIRTGPATFSPTVKRLESAPGIGYLRIPDLIEPSMGPQIEEGLAALLDEGPLDGLIVDLRSNPGGYYFPAVEQFVSGEVGRSYSRDGTRGFPEVVPAGGLIDELADVPLVVLVDNRSNSASEISAGILQAERGATVVGVRTPGNVEGVNAIDMSDGSRLFLALVVTRLDGQNLEVTGVVPDVPVEVEWTAYPESEDPQILTAVEVLQGGAEATPAA